MASAVSEDSRRSMERRVYYRILGHNETVKITTDKSGNAVVVIERASATNLDDVCENADTRS